MTEAGKASYTPVDVPAELEPRWEQRYRGRFRHELDAMQSAGITPEVDFDALNAGRLALTFDWRLDAGTTLHPPSRSLHRGREIGLLEPP